MSDYININWQQYKKVTKWCSECWAEWLHNCSGKKYPWSDKPFLIDQIEELWEDHCAWDSMPETFPWSWIKIWWLVCNCKRCTIYC